MSTFGGVLVQDIDLRCGVFIVFVFLLVVLGFQCVKDFGFWWVFNVSCFGLIEICACLLCMWVFACWNRLFFRFTGG